MCCEEAISAFLKQYGSLFISCVTTNAEMVEPISFTGNLQSTCTYITNGLYKTLLVKALVLAICMHN